MDIRDLVKERVAAGEKQVDIAKKAGVSQGTIYKLLHTDTKPTLDIIIKIAKAYNKPISLYTDEIDFQREPLEQEDLPEPLKKTIEIFLEHPDQAWEFHSLILERAKRAEKRKKEK